VIFCFPKAANMTMEGVRACFEHGFGVGYAKSGKNSRGQMQSGLDRVWKQEKVAELEEYMRICHV
jgi:hypothetical protein